VIPFHLAESGRDLGGGFVVTVYVDADSPAGEVPRAFVDLNTMLELLDRLSECRLQLSNATAVIESARAVVVQLGKEKQALRSIMEWCEVVLIGLEDDGRLTDEEAEEIRSRLAAQ